MEHEKKCVLCQVSDQESPLLNFDFKGNKYYICSGHIPVLIHKSNQLEHLLPGITQSDKE